MCQSSNDAIPSAIHVSAVLATQRAGSVFVMVTARPPRWLHDLSDLVGDHGVAIVANGAILYDVVRRKAIRTRLIEPGVALDVARAIRAEIPEVQFAIERSDRYGQEPHYGNRWPMPGRSSGNSRGEPSGAR